MTAALRRLGRKHTRMELLEDAVDVPRPDPDRSYALYLHVPFCMVLCPFCSFHRVEYREDKALRYFEALRREIRMAHDVGYRFTDVYVGGGTPTVQADEMVRTLELVRALNPVRCISIETNPDDLVPETLARLKAAGVDRVSVGVQSLDDRLLKEMQRYDKYGSAAQIRERLAAARGLFRTLNVDMIFNLPHQTLDSLLRDLAVLTGELQVDQISCYPLMGARSTMRAMRKDMGEVGYERERVFYEAILDALPDTYRADSGWCFSRLGEGLDEYIVEQEEYLGLGSGAMSYLDGTLYAASFSINRYIQLVNAGASGITRYTRFGERDRMRYWMLMRFFSLRVAKAEARARWQGRFERTLWKELALLRAVGAVTDDGETWRLTRRGMYYWVLMMREFFIAVSDFRDLMRLGIRSELDPEERAGLTRRASGQGS